MHHNLRKYAKQNLKFFPSLTYTEDFVWSTFYRKTAGFFKLFSKRACWNLLIFDPHVVQTYPERPACSELMSNFDGIYLEKKYGVPPPSQFPPPPAVLCSISRTRWRSKRVLFCLTLTLCTQRASHFTIRERALILQFSSSFTPSFNLS